MKNTVIFLIVLTTFMVACHQSPEKIEKDAFDKAIEQVNMDRSYQWIVVLPGMGCTGCIQEGEAFLKNYVSDKRILFVLTKVSSLKILQQKAETRIDKHANIYIDKDNLFDIPTDNRIYPCVIQLKDGKIIGYSFQNPSSEVLWQLKKQLD